MTARTRRIVHELNIRRVTMTESEFGCVLTLVGICGITLAVGGVLYAIACLGSSIVNWLENQQEARR